MRPTLYRTMGIPHWRTRPRQSVRSHRSVGSRSTFEAPPDTYSGDPRISSRRQPADSVL